MRRKRRNHLLAFKANVALAALQGEKTMEEFFSEYDVHVNQVESFQAKIGQLTMKNDFLAKILKS